MSFALLADAVVIVHLLFIAFAVLGGFLAWRWPQVLWLHLPALGWATWMGLTGGICPLTPLENRLRRLAGQEGYEGGFIEHYLIPLLYPVGLTRERQWLLVAAMFALNSIAFHVLITRWRRKRR